VQHVTGIMQAALATADTTGERSPILPLWGELIFGLIAFGILLWVVTTKVVPNLEKVYAERTAAIEGGMAQAQEAQAQAAATKAEYEAQLAEARAEANRIREDAREQGASIIAELRVQAQAEAARITESAKRQIEAERSQAAMSLRGDVGRMSTDLATRIVGESIDDTVSANIIERFLADLESGQIAPEKFGSDGAGQDS
jgi:F-type H+-transporting ATPase subunit b